MKGAASPEIMKSFIIDAHIDLPYLMMNHSNALSLSALNDAPFTLDKARKSGVRLFCTALYCADNYNGTRSFRHFQEVLQFTVEHFDDVTVVKNRDDLTFLQRSPELTATLFLLENADALTENLSYIPRMKQEGIMIAGLTHAGKNRLADGNDVLHSDGLTPDGREVIRTLTENSILIDIAHLHPKCFWQLLAVTEAPVISSHTGIRELCNIQRNIDLEQAGEIIKRGGVVGITFNPDMLTIDGTASTEHAFAHLDTLVQKLGPDGVGIGSDFCGFTHVTEGLEDVTGIRNLVEMMRLHGYDEGTINKILGLNWVRLFRVFL